MATNNDNKGSRSWKGQVVGGDSYAITLNFKWLLQIIGATAVVVYGWYQLETRIQELERNMGTATEQVESLNEERRLAEEKHIRDLEAQMQQQAEWYEQELGINFNPFSWGKGKGK